MDNLYNTGLPDVSRQVRLGDCNHDGYGNMLLPAMMELAQATSNDDSSADHNAMINDGSINVKVPRHFDSPRYTKKETKTNG